MGLAQFLSSSTAIGTSITLPAGIQQGQFIGLFVANGNKQPYLPNPLTRTTEPSAPAGFYVSSEASFGNTVQLSSYWKVAVTTDAGAVVAVPLTVPSAIVALVFHQDRVTDPYGPLIAPDLMQAGSSQTYGSSGQLSFWERVPAHSGIGVMVFASTGPYTKSYTSGSAKVLPAPFAAFSGQGVTMDAVMGYFDGTAAGNLQYNVAISSGVGADVNWLIPDSP